MKREVRDLHFSPLLVALIIAFAFPWTALSQTTAGTAANAEAVAVRADGESPIPASDGAEEAADETEPAADPRLVRAAERLLARADAVVAEFEDLSVERDAAVGEDFRVLEKQVVELKLEYLGLMGKIVDNLLEQEKNELDAADLRETVEEALLSLGPSIIAHIEESEEALATLRRDRETVTPDALLEFDQNVTRQSNWVVTLYDAYVDEVLRLESIGLTTTGFRDDLSGRLASRATREGGRLQLIAEQSVDLRARASEDPDDVALSAMLPVLEARRQAVKAGLASVVKQMEALDLDATSYQQLIISTTGEVTTDIFKPKVAIGLVEESIGRGIESLRENGPAVALKLVLFLLILSAARVLSRVTRRLLVRGFASSNVHASQLLQSMAVNMVSNMVMVVGVLVGLSQLGLELGPLLAGLGIAGFIVGFALQDSLANFAAGMMILGYRPFDVGDLIEAGGVFGNVSHMSLVNTTILTIDNQTLIVPNGKIWGDVIKNITQQDQRRVDMKFRISYADNVDHAENIFVEILDKHEKVLRDPEPMVKLHELNESSVDFIVRPWARTSDYWDVYWDVTRQVKKRFDEEGISIPVPQRELRIRDDRGGDAR